MNSSISKYCINHIHKFILASTNILYFLPSFFSVSFLLTTLFSPWKKLEELDNETSLSLQQKFDQFTFNSISRMVGALMRIATLFLFLCTTLIYILFLPWIFIIYVLILPVRYFLHNDVNEEKKVNDLKVQFINSHTNDKKYLNQVEKWWDYYYTNKYIVPFWDEMVLHQITPIGRDWIAGYTPNLNNYCTKLPEKKYNNPVIGRVNEITEIETALLKTQNANILLVGEKGVGKKSLLNTLALNIMHGKSHPSLLYKRILEIDINKILSETNDDIIRIQLISSIFKEAEHAGNIILVINEIDKYCAKVKGGLDLSSLFSQYGKSSDLHLIGITTPFAYQKYIYSNLEMQEMFIKIDIKECSIDEAAEILTHNAILFEQKYNILFLYESLLEIITKSNTYITNIPLPEKALLLLDEIATFHTTQKKESIILPLHVDKYLQQKLNIPIILDLELKNKLSSLYDKLAKRILQQDEALEKLVSTLQKSFVTSVHTQKPLASFLFLGPTGVGKTETAKALHEIFFSNNSSIVRFDMSNFQNKSDIPKLLGNSTTNSPGSLITSLRENPHCVLLLDEIEKANIDLLNIFLTLLDEAYITDMNGEKVDCKNTMIIATSNAASGYIYQTISNKQKLSTNQIINYLISEKLFTPEFLNRFDGIVVFNPLTPATIIKLAQIYIHTIAKQIQQEHGISIDVTNSYIQKIIASDYDQSFGARNLQRIITEHIESTIAKLILENKLKAGDKYIFN